MHFRIAGESLEEMLITTHHPTLLHDANFPKRTSNASRLKEARSEEDPAPPKDVRVCCGCGEEILEAILVETMNEFWHSRCLRCCICRISLGEDSSCYTRNTQIYCKKDYFKVFNINECRKCHLSISSTDLIMKAKSFLYHLNCFTCSSCQKALLPGEFFIERNEKLFCELHLVDANSEFNTTLSYVTKMKNLFPSSVSSPSAPFKSKGRPKKSHAHKGSTKSEDSSILLPFSSNFDIRSKNKRIRTSFKHHQLRVMKTYFDVNHNPDAKDLKQLSQKTGLTKRVLQVWFQNARAKYRRNGSYSLTDSENFSNHVISREDLTKEEEDK